MPKFAWLENNKKVAAVSLAIAVVGSCAGVLSFLNDRYGDEPDTAPTSAIAGAPAISPSTVALSPTPPGGTPAASRSATGDPGDQQSAGPGAGPADAYLSDLEAIEGDSTIHTAKLYDGRTTREYNSSILTSINNFSKTKTYAYAIENEWKTFRATIGIDTSSKPGAEVLFRVYLNDDPIDSGYLLDMQETKELAVPVAGKGRITLITTTAKSGGVGNSGRAVWGDARFTVD